MLQGLMQTQGQNSSFQKRSRKMPEPPKHEAPYIAPERNIPETTVRAIVLGAILAVVMGAANCYLGLKAGMTVSASIPAAVVSMAILRGLLRRGTVLENNIVQTMASTGESLAAGAIFTIPALVLTGAWEEFYFWRTTLIVLLGGLLGILFMVPIRRALIVDRPDLVYPEGVACSEVLIVGEKGGSGIMGIVAGLGLGAVFKLLVSGFYLVQDTLMAGARFGGSAFAFGVDASPALVAVGYIVNLRIASLVFLGGVIGWVVAIPLLGGAEGDTSAGLVDFAFGIWSDKVRYIGVGAMLAGGLFSIFQVRKGIVAGICALGGVRANSADGATGVPRTERSMPLPWLAGLLALTIVASFFFYYYLIGNLGIAAVTAAIMVCASFLFVAVATYIVGLVGSSNSPVSGMTICALLLAGGVLFVCGVRGQMAILATLGVAGIVCCAACTSGDIAQDLKTGLIVGATPARQQWTEILAAVIAAGIFAPVMGLLHGAFVIGSDELLAPQATLFASLTEGIFGEGDLPIGMIKWGLGIGAALIILDKILERMGSEFRLHVMPVAVGIYLPIAMGAAIFIGGLIRLASERVKAKSSADSTDTGILFGSGLIAGEAFMGIGLALLLPLGIKLWRPDDSNWIGSLAAFAILIGVFCLLAMRKPAK